MCRAYPNSHSVGYRSTIGGREIPRSDSRRRPDLREIKEASRRRRERRDASIRRPRLHVGCRRFWKPVLQCLHSERAIGLVFLSCSSTRIWLLAGDGKRGEIVLVSRTKTMFYWRSNGGVCGARGVRCQERTTCIQSTEMFLLSHTTPMWEGWLVL